jgi:hypothetical protein
MRVPRVRFSVRGLMIAVAVVAMAISANSWRIELARRAASYKVMERYYRTVITSPGATPEYLELFAAWRLDMVLKYERAARYPWISVPRDPGPPPRP